MFRKKECELGLEDMLFLDNLLCASGAIARGFSLSADPLAAPFYIVFDWNWFSLTTRREFAYVRLGAGSKGPPRIKPYQLKRREFCFYSKNLF